MNILAEGAQNTLQAQPQTKHYEAKATLSIIKALAKHLTMF